MNLRVYTPSEFKQWFFVNRATSSRFYQVNLVGGSFRGLAVQCRSMALSPGNFQVVIMPDVTAFYTHLFPRT
jgi:hypothetical protein